MTEYRLDEDHLKIHYDTETGIGTTTYQATLMPQHTSEAYKWFMEVIAVLGLEKVRGLIFDFRNVLKFEQGNFQAVKRESQQMNQALDLSHFPVALLVGNLYQEEMVRVASKITGQETRVKIVHSEESAMNFINHWHSNKQRDSHDPVSSGE